MQWLWLRISRIAALSGVLAAVALVLPLGAAAHEHRDVLNDQYSMTVGFLAEPAFAGEQNGLSLDVEKHVAGAAATPAAGEEEAGTPVEGLAATLQAEVIYGDQTMALALSPRFGQPGSYQAVFFPMAEGDYTFRIFGQIEGNPVDESFTSSPEGFDSVQSREPLEFPKSSGDAGAGVVAAGVSSGGTGIDGALIGGLGLLAAAFGGWLVRRRLALQRAPVPVQTRGEVRA
jgi:hypothetical protein